MNPITYCNWLGVVDHDQARRLDYDFSYYGLELSRYTPTAFLTTRTISGRVFIASFSEEPSFPDDFGSNDILVLDNPTRGTVLCVDN